MKWQPIAAMLGLIALALWLVVGGDDDVPLADGARGVQLRLGTGKGVIEIIEAPDAPVTYRVRFPGEAEPTRALTAEEFAATFGMEPLRLVREPAGNWVFHVLNITSWPGLLWVVVGFFGQALFFARMMVQWVASEREKKSVVPVGFWWLSLLGGAMLFGYFVWRRDIIGVLGQTTGVVVYARNLRLIYKVRAAGG